MPRINTTVAFADGGDTVSSSAIDLEDIGFTTAQIDQANRAWISVSGEPVRYRYTGTAPTASVGHYIAADTTIEIAGNSNLRQLQFIAVSADAAIWITLED
jgi:hypothetical protein